MLSKLAKLVVLKDGLHCVSTMGNLNFLGVFDILSGEVNDDYDYMGLRGCGPALNVPIYME